LPRMVALPSLFPVPFRRSCLAYPRLREAATVFHAPEETAYGDSHGLARRDSGEEVGFLQKPFSPHSLVTKVREVLDGLPVR